MKIAIIKWLDSATDTDPTEMHTLSDPIEPLEVMSAGIIVENSDKSLTISRDLFYQPNGVNTVRFRISIPKFAIKSMIVLNISEDKK
jgi:hypothetical protein